MSEPMTFQKKSRRERYIVRDDVANLPLVDTMHRASLAWCIFCGRQSIPVGQWGQKERKVLNLSNHVDRSQDLSEHGLFIPPKLS